ncbi:MAG TPA: AEC family transporter [Nevskiaceae bacterium]|nr:AEC family transporter [Nevskiaceae bacterium]
MSAFILLVVCLLLGFAAARWLHVPEGTPAAINFWVLDIALPALVLLQVSRLQFDPSLLFPALAPWFVVIGALLVFAWLGRRRRWSAGTIGALTLTCGLGNTAFMGLPMVEAFRGPQALGAAIIADQLGTFLALSTLGVAIAAHYSGRSTQPRELIRRVVTFPPFVALVVAVLVRALGGWPAWCVDVLARIGGSLTPLALFSVGLQFRFGDLAHHVPRVAAGLSWKLFVAPLAVCVAAAVLKIDHAVASVAILQCAMAPMVSAGMLAEQHELDPPLANTVVGIGILTSLATVPLWSFVLG